MEDGKEVTIVDVAVVLIRKRRLLIWFSCAGAAIAALYFVMSIINPSGSRMFQTMYRSTVQIVLDSIGLQFAPEIAKQILISEDFLEKIAEKTKYGESLAGKDAGPRAKSPLARLKSSIVIRSIPSIPTGIEIGCEDSSESMAMSIIKEAIAELDYRMERMGRARNIARLAIIKQKMEKLESDGSRDSTFSDIDRETVERLAEIQVDLLLRSTDLELIDSDSDWGSPIAARLDSEIAVLNARYSAILEYSRYANDPPLLRRLERLVKYDAAKKMRLTYEELFLETRSLPPAIQVYVPPSVASNPLQSSAGVIRTSILLVVVAFFLGIIAIIAVNAWESAVSNPTTKNRLEEALRRK
jgi:hypothetical protein